MPLTADDSNRWLLDKSNDVIKPPRIVPVRFGIDGFDVLIDSPLGYEPQGRFDTVKEALDYADENWDMYWR